MFHFSPEGKRFASLNQLLDYYEQQGNPLDPLDFKITIRKSPKRPGSQNNSPAKKSKNVEQSTERPSSEKKMETVTKPDKEQQSGRHHEKETNSTVNKAPSGTKSKSRPSITPFALGKSKKKKMTVRQDVIKSAGNVGLNINR